MLSQDLIKPHHLKRLAIIYVRQSSPHQVLTNTESHRLQLALRERAEALGWSSDRIRVLEADTARSAKTLAGRADFQELVTLVSTDQAGVIFAYDAQRLARNCTDWYPLLDVCGFRQCLIADGDGVYDPADPNDRLLLGLKGQIAEWELHILQRRCLDAVEAKAQRGELDQNLPAGLDRDAAGVVRKTADQEVQDRLTLIFELFERHKSVAQTVRALCERGLSVPRRDRFGHIVWRVPTNSSVLLILTNPAYAGAYVRGRRRPYRNAKGKMRLRLLPMSQWRICLRGKYPAYLSWERFEAIYAMIQDNYQEYARRLARGVPRAGQALLQGLVYCGECGHKMAVQYKSGSRYLCNFWRRQTKTRAYCQCVPGRVLEDWVVQQFFSALSAAELDLYAASLEQSSQEQSRVAQAWQQQLQRLRYQAQLAERQFLAADPDNRLVAGELERRWEEALRALQEAEAAWQREQARQPAAALAPELRELLESAGRRLPELWRREDFLSQPQRKAMLRCLIDKVVAHRMSPERMRVRIVWRGGQSTEAALAVAVGAWRDLPFAEALERAIVKLAREGKSDEEIARELTLQGYRSPRADTVLPATVHRLRIRRRIYRKANQSGPRSAPGFLAVAEVAEQLGVEVHWVYHRIHNGTIRVTKDAERHTYLFPDKPKTMKQLRQLRDGQLQTLQF